MRRNAPEDMPYIVGRPELYKDDAIEDRETGRAQKAKPYVGKLLEIEESPKKVGKTTIIKKMIKDMQATELEPLQTIGSKVSGNIFDKAKFLKERISETEATIKSRESLNDIFNAEIDKDIDEMEKMITTLAEKDDIREFKLNVSLLRMEKRKENTSFWRDLTELKSQLQELNEQLEVESKIADLFNDLNM